MAARNYTSSLEDRWLRLLERVSIVVLLRGE